MVKLHGGNQNLTCDLFEEKLHSFHTEEVREFVKTKEVNIRKWWKVYH